MTKSCFAWLAGMVLLVAGPFPPVRAEQTLPSATSEYLSATFNDKTIDEPIGTNGPAYGEPDWKHDHIAAIVRATPFTTPCLEISNTSPDEGGTIAFSLVGAPITDGVVAVIVDLWFDEIAEGRSYTLWVRTPDSMHDYLILQFQDDGLIRVNDAVGFGGNFPYAAGRPFPILIGYDMTAGTYSLWLDGAVAFTDRDFSLAAAGIGVVQLATWTGGIPEARLWVDQIRVVDFLPPVAAGETSWGQVKALFGQ
ncbi:MAG: hypothetical protein V1774_09735 [Candidatus Eisenbacteria bacterium]